MVFDFGNGTRNSGRFFENCAGKFKDQYITRSIDSRKAHRVNKKSVEKDIEMYGADSDFVKVRWRGMFPNKSTLQFVDGGEVMEAMTRKVISTPSDDPIIIGVDVALSGNDHTVIYPRWGWDARSFEPRRYHNLKPRQIANKVVEYMEELQDLGLHVAQVFVDMGGGYGSGVLDRLEESNVNATGVIPGEKADNDVTYRLRCDEMWGNLREKLPRLALPDRNTPHGERIYNQLTQREYGHTLKEQVKLESKDDMRDRGLESPDDVDALALTFAFPVSSHGTRSSRAGFIEMLDPDPYENILGE